MTPETYQISEQDLWLCLHLIGPRGRTHRERNKNWLSFFFPILFLSNLLSSAPFLPLQTDTTQNIGEREKELAACCWCCCCSYRCSVLFISSILSQVFFFGNFFFSGVAFDGSLIYWVEWFTLRNRDLDLLLNLITFAAEWEKNRFLFFYFQVFFLFLYFLSLLYSWHSGTSASQFGVQVDYFGVGFTMLALDLYKESRIIGLKAWARKKISQELSGNFFQV